MDLINVLYLFGSMLFIFFPFVIYGKRVKSHAYKSVNLFAIFFGFTYFFVPFISLVSGEYWHQEGYLEDTLLTSFLLFLIFGFAVISTFIILDYSYGRSRFAGLDPSLWKVVPETHIRLIILILLTPALFAFYKIISIIGFAGISAFFSNRIVLLSGSGYVVMALGWPAILLTIYYANCLAKTASSNHKIGYLFMLPLLLISIVSGIISGSRTAILTPIIFLAFSSLMLNSRGYLGKAALIKISLFSTAILTVAILLGSIREQVFVGRDVVVETGELSISTTLIGSFGEYENVWWLVENMSSQDLLYGKTFAAAFVGFIPRQIWPDKPLGGGPYLRNMIRPGSYDLTSGTNLTSYTTGLPAEAVMNFGYFGLLLIGSIFGIALWYLDILYRNMSNSVQFCLWFILQYRAIFSLKAEFFGNISYIFISCVPIIAFFVLIRLMNPSPKTTPIGGWSENK